MNGPGDTPDPEEKPPCGISSFFPISMSCRGRAEAFARRLQSRLRTLGSQVGNIYTAFCPFLTPIHPPTLETFF